MQFVTSEQDIADLITIGDNAKAVSATNMNARSSRSHRYCIAPQSSELTHILRSLFMIIIEQKDEDGSTKVGKLNLVDLAGSEKIGKTGATGQTLEEVCVFMMHIIYPLNRQRRLTNPFPLLEIVFTHLLKQSVDTFHIVTPHLLGYYRYVLVCLKHY